MYESKGNKRYTFRSLQREGYLLYFDSKTKTISSDNLGNYRNVVNNFY